MKVKEEKCPECGNDMTCRIKVEDGSVCCMIVVMR